MKGLAEMPVKADLAVWEIKFITTGNALDALQKKMTSQKEQIEKFLLTAGFTPQEIQTGRMITTDVLANPYRSNENVQNRYILQQTLTVQTSQVDLVEKTLSRTSELIAEGIVFDGQEYTIPVSYIFTKLNDIKPKMLEMATRNAKASAEEFAKSSGAEVGHIRRANQGVFSVLPAVESSNANEMSQIDKKVRVVSTIDYWLK